MALVTRINKIKKDRHRVHAPVACECSIFHENGSAYLQLDTFGTEQRELHGKMSQSLQFDRQGADALRRLLDEAFPD